MEFNSEAEIWLALILLIAAMVSYIWEKVRMEITSISLFLGIIVISSFSLPNWPSFTEIMKVFASEAPVTIIAMFMVSAALTRHPTNRRTLEIFGELYQMGLQALYVVNARNNRFFLRL